jgi:hypothetical protein
MGSGRLGQSLGRYNTEGVTGRSGRGRTRPGWGILLELRHRFHRSWCRIGE